MTRFGRPHLICALIGWTSGLAPADSVAQQPLSIGTAAGFGGTAVTEARRADAILWNPALVGIWEGPESSYSFLSVDMGRVPNGAWFEDASGFDLLGRADRLGMVGVLDRLLPNDASLPGWSGGVTWAAFQFEDIAISVSTHAVAGARFPEHLLPENTDWTVAGDGSETFRSTSSVLGVTKAGFFGPFPVLGPLWLGATAKGLLVHSFAQGGFGDGQIDIGDRRLVCPAGDEIFCEGAFRNVPGYGLDLGFAFAPSRAVRFGAALQNAFSAFMRPTTSPSIRYWLPESEAGTVSGIDASYDGSNEHELVQVVWDNLEYPAVIRAGAAYASRLGTVAGSVTETLRSGGMQPDWMLGERFGASYQGPQGVPLRALVGFGGDAVEYGGAIEFGRCDRLWTVGLGRRRSDVHGVSYSANASLAFTDPFCLRPR